MTELLTALKQSTGPYHQSLEQKLNSLDPEMLWADYLKRIKVFWDFCQPLEARLANVAELKTCLPDFQARLRAAKVDQQRVIKAACQTFQTFEQWLVS